MKIGNIWKENKVYDRLSVVIIYFYIYTHTVGTHRLSLLTIIRPP